MPTLTALTSILFALISRCMRPLECNVHTAAMVCTATALRPLQVARMRARHLTC